MTYKWDNPYEWLKDKYDQGEIDANDLMNLIKTSVDLDAIEEYFGSDMDQDGYYIDYVTCICCSEEVNSDDLQTCDHCGDKVCSNCIVPGAFVELAEEKYCLDCE